MLALKIDEHERRATSGKPADHPSPRLKEARILTLLSTADEVIE
jgi:hypothetical protein